MRKKEFKEAPLNYWEEQSYMIVIKENNEDNLKNIIAGISSIKEVKIRENRYNIEKNCLSITLEYDQVTYEVGFYDGAISIPEYYLNGNVFSDEEKERILNTKKALTIFMKFSENAKKSYHLQLKLAVAIIPNLIAILDESAEKMLPSKWVQLAAKSKVLPSSRHLFSVQAVIDESKNVWLHTHGLCRCGITELEILESNAENQQNHYNLINTYAMYLLDQKEQIEPYYVGSYIGRLENGYPIVVTCIPWTLGVLQYKKLQLGDEKSRKNGHNTKTSILFCYQNEKEEQKNILSKLSIYDKQWGNNPLFFFSDEETARMKELAMERFSYVKKYFNKQENEVLIKIGLYSEKEENFEHIWFELLEIKGDKFKARLTQEPYYFDDIHTGYEAWYKKEDITDWIIYAKEYNINPDTVYLLEREIH